MDGGKKLVKGWIQRNSCRRTLWTLVIQRHVNTRPDDLHRSRWGRQTTPTTVGHTTWRHTTAARGQWSCCPWNLSVGRRQLPPLYSIQTARTGSNASVSLQMLHASVLLQFSTNLKVEEEEKRRSSFWNGSLASNFLGLCVHWLESSCRKVTVMTSDFLVLWN